MSDIDKTKRRDLFVKYLALQQDIDEAKKLIAELQGKASDIAEEIAAHFGRGPFKFDGVQYTVVERKARKGADDQRATWFMRSPQKKDAEEV